MRTLIRSTGPRPVYALWVLFALSVHLHYISEADAAVSADSANTPIRRSAWALVLSGGAARGFAFVGTQRAFEEEGLRPDLIVGTSAGGLMGAMWASGYSSRTVHRMLDRIDWGRVFGTRESQYEWRETVLPRALLTLTSQASGLHFASALVDDAYLNYALSVACLRGEALAQGDFDRLPVPLRVVGTDVSSLRPVVLRSGSLARAVRITASTVPFFAPMPDGQRILVDGGMASNLPISVARERGIDHIVAVDVAKPNIRLDEYSSTVEVVAQLYDLLNKRGQMDTLSAQDRLIWMTLPGASSVNYLAYDRAISAGYRVCRPRAREIADSLDLRRNQELATDVPVLLPPVAAGIPWTDRFGRPSGRSLTARRLLGKLPSGPFVAEALGPPLERVYRSNLFRSAWPSLRVVGDSTFLSFEVRERAPRELSLSAGYDTDLLGRANATARFRPLSGPLPALIVLGGTVRRYGWRASGSIEPHSLENGSNGWFLRGGSRGTTSRLFDGERHQQTVNTERVEAMIGAQHRLQWGGVLQIGAGGGRVWSEGRSQQGPMAAVRLESSGRYFGGIETEALVGTNGYISTALTLGVQLSAGALQVQPTLRAAHATKRTPLDEMEGLGGLDSFGGLRDREWLGRKTLGLDLRAIRRRGIGSAYAYLQAGVIDDVLSRPDLGGRLHVATGIGTQLDIPFGPVRLDWGIDDKGENRLNFQWGQRF